MKKSFSCLAALGLLTAAISSFASEANPYSWSGLYTGLNLGYGWSNSSITFNNTPPSINVKGEGGLFGGQVGFDWQIKHAIVIGLAYATDIAGMTGGNSGAGSSSERIDWIGSLLPRLGYLPIQNLLFYGTGGLAFGNLTGSITSPASITPNSINITSPGWAVGAGAEWIFVPHWSFSAEYLYNQLENGTGVGSATNEPFTNKIYYQTTELKLNWRMSL